MITDKIYRILTSLTSPGGNGGKLQIFIFHRVLDELTPFSMGEPDKKRFEELIRLLSYTFNIIPLAEAIERISTNSLPKRAACITFDDGYLDNYTNAYPILKKYNIPATIFIATSYIGRGIMWNDIVIEAIRSYSGILNLAGLDIINQECFSDEQRKQIIQYIIPKIKHLPQSIREEYVCEIESFTGYTRVGLMMNKDEIIDLHQNNITIGAHTQTHPILVNLSEKQSENEIAGSKEELELILGENVELFAYPNGKPDVDYTNRDVEIVKNLGFKAAVSTRLSIAAKSDSIYELPRFTPWDNSITKFMLRSCYAMYKKSA